MYVLETSPGSRGHTRVYAEPCRRIETHGCNVESRSSSWEFAIRFFVAFTTVSIVMTACTGADEPDSEPSRRTHPYVDPAGWSARIPAGWTVEPFETSKGDASAVGVQIANVHLPDPVIEPGLPIQASGVVVPPHGVSLIIATDNDPRNGQVLPASPPSPPLSLDDFAQGSTTGGGPTFSFLWFEASGNVLLASIKAGPQADLATLASLVGSIPRLASRRSDTR